jgi:arabinan endo-1,5-alpha-L-arabinosidase
MSSVRRIIAEPGIRQFWRDFASAAILMLITAPGQAQSVSGSLGIHDPSTIVKENSKYFVYGDGQGITAKFSSDHEAWTDIRSVFPINSPPSWTTTAVPGFAGYFWAPDVAYFNNLLAARFRQSASPQAPRSIPPVLATTGLIRAP